MKLAHILSTYVAPVKLGVDPEKLKLEQLRRDLEMLRRESSAYFSICIAFTLVVFALSSWSIIANSQNAAFVGISLAAGGLGITASFVAIVRLWREKVATDVILSLCHALEPDMMRTVVTVLANRLR